MFGKIKDKLKGVFEKSEELIEENPDEEVEVSSEELVEDIPEEKKKSFLSKVFGKKEEVEEDLDEAEEGSEEIVEDEPIKVEEFKPKKEKKKSSKKKEIIKEVKASPEEMEKESLDSVEKEVEDISEIDSEIKEEKKGFFSKVFGKKEEESLDTEELEELPQEIEKESLDSVEKKIEDIQNLDEEVKEEGVFTKAFTKLKSKKIDIDDFDKIWVELQIFLLEINIAYEIVEKIEIRLKEELINQSFNRFKLSQKIREVLESEIENVLVTREANFKEKLNEIKLNESGPVKILILGVNGTGKTTTIAKIVNYLQKNNLSVAVAAADTFRAAAIEQLEEHSKKLNFKLIMHKNGSDPAAVAFDAIEHATAKKLDVVLIDTAGRMPNNSNLMNELQKVKRISKAHLALFVGDSIAGNDLIDQIELFNKGVEIDGAILTKVDTDEKPGSIVTTAFAVEKPIYFLGNGQTYDDLIEFDAKLIAQKLFETDDD